MDKQSILFVFLNIFLLNAATINVPLDIDNIGQAIEVSSNGDTVLVNDGSYNEGTLEIRDKYIYLISVNGPTSTYLSGGNLNRVLFIDHGFEELCHVEGFTIENGRPGSDNHASAIKVSENSKALFKNLIIQNNGGGSGNTVAFGGGIESTTFMDCIVKNNSVENYAGIRSSTVIRCDLYDNTGWNNTGVLLNCKSINCTVRNNGGGPGNPWTTSGLSGGTAVNCIFWGNAAQDIYDAESVTYSIIESGYIGEGNLSIDPLLYNDSSILQENSPAIDSGNPETQYNDPDGTRNDMGAYYVHQETGCTDSYAENYNENASVDDGSCEYPDNGNYALNFDGADDYVDLGNNELVGPTQSNPLTMSLWVKLNSLNNIIASKYENLNSNNSNFYLGTTNDGQFSVSGNGTNAFYFGTVELNQWQHLTVVFDNSTITSAYVNGVLANSGQINLSSNISSEPLLIGAMSPSSLDKLNGLVDEVAVWSTALNQEQIQSNMNTELLGNEEGLIGYWNFNSGSGDILYDRSGNQNHGIINGATWSTDVEQTLLGMDDFTSVGSFNGHNYYISNEGGDYLKGKLSCELIGGNLVTITSQEENDFVIQALMNFGGGSNHLWLGMDDVDNDGTYQWVTGEEVVYENFNNSPAPGQAVEMETPNGNWGDTPLDDDQDYRRYMLEMVNNDQPEYSHHSLNFDGEDDYVLIAEASSYIQHSDASLMGWFKINEFDGINPLFGFRNYPDDYCSMYAVMGTNGTIETMVYGNLQSYNSGHDANQWYHLAMVFNSQTETFNTYVNGELGSSIATPSSIFDCRDIDLLIGGMQIGNFETLNGSIDDVSLWVVSLTQDDIQAHMNTELSGDETGLAGYWNFNEGEGSILTDLSDNRIDGDIIGATWSDDGAPVMPGSIATIEVDLVQGYPNSEVSVPVHIDLMQESVSSVEISFSGFQDHMEFIDLELEGAMIGDAEWNVVLNAQQDLLLTLSYGANEISGEGVLFNLRLNIPEQAETDFVPIMIEQVQLDELDGSIEILNGGVQINAIVWGDVSQNGDVSGYDASLILKYLVGSEELDEAQIHVADVTQDATISALDASAVAQYVVQLIDILPLEDPSSISGGGEFYFRDTELIPGEMLEIPIELTNGENLLSFEFSAEYDESVFTVEEIIWSELINHFTIEDNLVPGSINIAGMGTSPDGAEGTFGTIRLYVNPEFSDQNSSINLSYRINESVPIDNINIIIPNSSLGVDNTLTPKVFTLHQNYPNPFNPTTQIRYDLPQDALVSISIYDVMGRMIKSLSNANQTAGYHSLQWDATNDIGESVSAGMYIYTIQAGEYRSTKKMVLLK